MPNYVNEFDDKKKEEASARKEAQMEAELEREQEGVYKECQVRFSDTVWYIFDAGYCCLWRKSVVHPFKYSTAILISGHSPQILNILSITQSDRLKIICCAISS